jgi:hypothetical protein
MEVFPIERRIAKGTVLGRVEAQAGGGPVDPAGIAFEFEKYADRGFVDCDKSVFPGYCEFGPELFIAESRSVSQAIQNKFEGVGVGNVELDLFAALVTLAGCRTFISNGGVGAGAPQAEKLIGGAQFGGAAIENPVAFESTGLEDWIAAALDQFASIIGAALKANFDFGFDHVKAAIIMIR